MVCVVMGEQNVPHLVRLAPRLACGLQDDFSMIRQAGIDNGDLVLSDQVGAHIAHPDPRNVRRDLLDRHLSPPLRLSRRTSLPRPAGSRLRTHGAEAYPPAPLSACRAR